MYARVPRFGLYIPYHEVRVVRIVSQDNLLLIQKVKIPESRPLQNYKVRVSCRFAVRGDDVLLGSARKVRSNLLITPDARITHTDFA